MKLRNSWDSRNAITAQLSKLLAFCGIYVDKPVHISNAEPLDAIRRVELPLRTQTVIIC
jgi:hypothetical protein